MNMKPRLFRKLLQFCCAGTILLSAPGLPLWSQETSRLVTIDVAGQEVQFVRLPNQADVNLGQETVSGKLPVLAAYMMSTELTAAVMKELIGNAHYDEYRKGLMLGKPSTPDHEAHQEKLNSGQEDIAACSVPMKQVFLCCEKLEGLILQLGLHSKVETVKVRLPTAAEWKYAVLGLDSLNDQRVFPRFPTWPTEEDVRRLIDEDQKLKGYLSDLQEKDPQYTIQAIASQDRFIDLIEASSNDKEKLPSGKTISEILGELLGHFLSSDKKTGLTSNPAIPGDAKRDYDARKGVANEFEKSGNTAVTSAVNILDHHRAGGGPIALPQFNSVGSVVSHEIDCVICAITICVNRCYQINTTVATSSVDIFDHHRTCGCSISLPQFFSVGPVISSEDKSVSKTGKHPWQAV